MLTRIVKIDGVGLFHGARGGAIKLEPLSLIYAGNGRGKSTLSAILRSVSLRRASDILERVTIDGSSSPAVTLQFESGQRANFQAGAWDCARPEIVVFDATFIEANVFSGVAVTSDHRRNLLDFAIGDRAVSARLAEEAATIAQQSATTAIQTKTAQIEPLKGHLSLADFQAIQPIVDIETVRNNLTRQLADALRAETISAQAGPSEFLVPELDLENIFELLGTQLEDIEAEAEAVVNEHVRSVPGDGVEDWLSQGAEHDDGSTCPYCAQSTDGIQLVRMYQTHFNEAYLALKARIVETRETVERFSPDGVVAARASERESINDQLGAWASYIAIELLGSDDDELVRDSIAALHDLLLPLLTLKALAPAESFGGDDEKEEARRLLSQITGPYEVQNASIQSKTQLIDGFKQTVLVSNPGVISGQLVDLELAAVRYLPSTVSLLADLATAKADLSVAEAARRLARENLTAIMATTLEKYRVDINSILLNLGAAFSIDRISTNYLGGTARTDYGISLRGMPVQLVGGQPSFSTALSEGDRRALAFAFFVASTLDASNLSALTVVIDDPVSSLDRHRRDYTIELLKKFADDSEQLIVLAHDALFLKAARDGLNKPAARPTATFQIVRAAGDYSDFKLLDLDRECETPYYSNYREVEQFVAATSNDARKAAVALRPVLEGYLHRRFPGLIPEGLMLGQVISLIAASASPSPLAYMTDWVPELRALNDFAGKFHHDTNAGYATEPADPGAVVTYGKRVLNVVYGGPLP